MLEAQNWEAVDSNPSATTSSLMRIATTLCLSSQIQRGLKKKNILNSSSFTFLLPRPCTCTAYHRLQGYDSFLLQLLLETQDHKNLLCLVPYYHLTLDKKNLAGIKPSYSTAESNRHIHYTMTLRWGLNNHSNGALQWHTLVRNRDTLNEFEWRGLWKI